MRRRPLSDHELRKALLQRLEEIGGWDETGRMRHQYPVSSPLASSLDLLAAFWERNYNNIGAHLEPPERLTGTRRLEAEVVRDIGNLLHAPDAEGWLTTGGTEGNITGLWLAREALTSRSGVTPVVYGTALTHDSIHKACRLLGLGPLRLVPLRHTAVMDPHALGAMLNRQESRGERPVIVVATVGATLTGTCDPVDEIGRVLQGRNHVHLHVDAAFAGMVLPFTDPRRPFDFRVPEVASLCVDLHKMARIPLGVGVFLARRGSSGVIQTPSICGNATDRTLLGSRPGAMAAAAWIGLNALGRQGMASTLRRCLHLKRRFLHQIAKAQSVHVVHDPAVNAVGVCAPGGAFPSCVRTRLYFMPHLGDEEVDGIAMQVIDDTRGGRPFGAKIAAGGGIFGNP